MTGNRLGKVIWVTIWATLALALWSFWLGVIVKMAVTFYKFGYGFSAWVSP